MSSNIAALNANNPYFYTSGINTKTGGYAAGQFGELTTKPQIERKPSENGYHQAYGFKPEAFSTENMEIANAWAEGVGSATNPYKTAAPQAVSGNFETRGAAWEGFGVKENNGTGELIPTITGREDAIEGSNFPPEGLWC